MQRDGNLCSYIYGETTSVTQAIPLLIPCPDEHYDPDGFERKGRWLD